MNPPRVVFNFRNGYLKIPQQAYFLIINKKGIIFDMDGTLIDMEKANYKMYKKTIRKIYCLNISLLDWKKMFKGRRPQDSVVDFLKSKGIKKGFNFKKFKQVANPIKRNIVFSELNNHAKILAGASEFLKHLAKDKKKKLALVTSTAAVFVKPILIQFKISEYFDLILTGESVSKGKPDAEVYLKALQALDLPNSDCLVFEDSESGIKAALTAGIDCIKVIA
jgi:HAD superfamily hydrolase (TIGR01509 family)